MTTVLPINGITMLDGYAQPMPLVFQLPEAVIAAGPDAWEACFWAIRLADTQGSGRLDLAYRGQFLRGVGVNDVSRPTV